MTTGIRGSGPSRSQDSFRTAVKSLGPDQRLDAEKAFTSLLSDTIRDAVGNALGQNVMEIIASKGLLDDAGNSKDFHRKLQSIFGNGAIVLERIVVKDLDRKLGIRYDSEADFDYAKSLETARDVCMVESRLN